MILDNLAIRGSEGMKQILIRADRIKAVYDGEAVIADARGKRRIRFENAIAFPGLINSHDHLDFNLFPQMANRVYKNYTEWGRDIHLTGKETIEAVRKIPAACRIAWGQYKNLLNGFTTVVNHGRKIRLEPELINIFQDCYSLHSPAFEKNWKWKLNNPLKTGRPFVMHIGEGVDELAGKEVDAVIKGNLFRKKLIAIHGIAMNRKQAAFFDGLVWCPASNYFLVGKTAPITELNNMLPVAFGTDSTLTADWNAWVHFRMAKETAKLKENDLFSMLTSVPAALWGLNDRGEIAENKLADIVVAAHEDDFFNINPDGILLVIHRGQIRLYDDSIADQVSKRPGQFSRIRINNSVKWVEGDVRGLIEKINAWLPEANLPISA